LHVLYRILFIVKIDLLSAKIGWRGEPAKAGENGGRRRLVRFMLLLQVLLLHHFFPHLKVAYLAWNWELGWRVIATIHPVLSVNFPRAWYRVLCATFVAMTKWNWGYEKKDEWLWLTGDVILWQYNFYLVSFFTIFTSICYWSIIRYYGAEIWFLFMYSYIVSQLISAKCRRRGTERVDSTKFCFLFSFFHTFIVAILFPLSCRRL
jgi:hypothetical protein